VWEQAAEAIGRAPRHRRWIHVSDRESDVFEYMAVCQSLGKDFVIRAFHNRRVDESEDTAEAAAQERRYLMELARQLVPQTEQTYAVEVPATVKKGVKQPKRLAQIRLRGPSSICLPPAMSKVTRNGGLDCPCVEPEPPVGVEAVEWILLTSLAVNDWDRARYITQIYECRWLVEDYHMCLKTGCRIEASQLDHGDDLQRLLGFLAPIAMRLLQLRQVVRTAPEDPRRHPGPAYGVLTGRQIQTCSEQYYCQNVLDPCCHSWGDIWGENPMAHRVGARSGRAGGIFLDWADGVRLLTLEKMGKDQRFRGMTQNRA